MIASTLYGPGPKLNIDSTLNANRNRPFVDRIINASKYPVRKNPDGSVSTHLMAWGTDDQGAFAFPTLRIVNGQWVETKNPGAAIKAGDYIRFKSDEDADYFTQHYKESKLSHIKTHAMGGSLYGNYKAKKYEAGGGLSALSTFGSAGGGISGIVDALNPPNQYGRQSMGTNIGKNVAQFGAMGAQFGPYGAAAGIAVGAVKGIVDAEKQKRVESTMKAQEAFTNRTAQLNKYQQMVASDPSSVSGNVGANYFADGGNLSQGKGSLATEYLKHSAKGGSLQQLSSDSVEVKGPSHEQGGVQLPDNNEVEGKETIKGDYVLSHRLGFAQVHKPIAKAIGQLEQKAPTAATMNSLRNLRKKEDALMLLQEMTKANMNNGN